MFYFFNSANEVIFSPVFVCWLVFFIYMSAGLHKLLNFVSGLNKYQEQKLDQNKACQTRDKKCFETTVLACFFSKWRSITVSECLNNGSDKQQFNKGWIKNCEPSVTDIMPIALVLLTDWIPTHGLLSS